MRAYRREARWPRLPQSRWVPGLSEVRTLIERRGLFHKYQWAVVGTWEDGAHVILEGKAWMLREAQIEIWNAIWNSDCSKMHSSRSIHT